MNFRLTRQDEADLPEFQSHDEARAYFKDRFGDDFMLAESQRIDGEKMYFYHLLNDRESYWQGMKELERDGFSTGMGLPMSYQSVEIWEDGRVHIVF